MVSISLYLGSLKGQLGGAGGDLSYPCVDKERSTETCWKLVSTDSTNSA